jgi:hypothetical protein
MSILKQFLALALGVLLLAQVALPALTSQIYRLGQTNEFIQEHRNVNKISTSLNYQVPDLTKISGSHIVGMAQKANAGEFVLVVDGMTIDNTTDLTTVNLAGAVGLQYDLSFNVDQNTGISIVTATH